MSPLFRPTLLLAGMALSTAAAASPVLPSALPSGYLDNFDDSSSYAVESRSGWRYEYHRSAYADGGWRKIKAGVKGGNHRLSYANLSISSGVASYTGIDPGAPEARIYWGLTHQGLNLDLSPRDGAQPHLLFDLAPKGAGGLAGVSMVLDVGSDSLNLSGLSAGLVDIPLDNWVSDLSDIDRIVWRVKGPGRLIVDNFRFEWSGGGGGNGGGAGTGGSGAGGGAASVNEPDERATLALGGLLFAAGIGLRRRNGRARKESEK